MFHSTNVFLELQLREDAVGTIRRRGLGGARAPVSWRSEVNGIPENKPHRGSRPPRRRAAAVLPAGLRGTRGAAGGARPRLYGHDRSRLRRADPRAPQPFDELLHPHLTCTDGGQQPAENRARCRGVPGRGAALARLRALRLPPEPDAGRGRRGASGRRAGRGVAVRFVYNLDHAKPDPGSAAAGAGRQS